MIAAGARGEPDFLALLQSMLGDRHHDHEDPPRGGKEKGQDREPEPDRYEPLKDVTRAH